MPVSLLLQDLIVTSVTLAVAIGAVARLVRWSRRDQTPACSNCPAKAERARPTK
jgi:hypothetical protein